MNRSHKRVDHIIEEASKLEGDFLLWIDGRPEEPELLELARGKLGARCRITHVPTEQVAQLYHLADVFVHAALGEGFGLAICEAAASGLRVLAHDSPHFQWLVGDRDCLLDMRVPGALAGRLRELTGAPRLPDRAGRLAKSMRERFDWQALAPQYRDMYRRVAAS
jgi:glycosyltransferase involved in cell wall biosynthesis